MSRPPTSTDGRPSPDLGFEDPEALAELRSGIFESVGLQCGPGLLYGLGLGRGLADGLRVSRHFASGIPAPPELAGSPLPLLFTPVEGQLPETLSGRMRAGIEAGLHMAQYLPAADPICFASAGYASGWYSGLLGEFYLVRETRCRATGAAACEFVARPVTSWLSAGDGWAEELLPYLDYAQLQETALEELSKDELPDEDGLLGGLDALSPAVHVWGPVMVLPYSGAEDSVGAVDTIREDIGERQVRVVVVDVTGVCMDSIEAAGLLRLVDDFEARGLEAVLVGARRASGAAWGSNRRHLSIPLLADDLAAAVALAFQLSRGSAD